MCFVFQKPPLWAVVAPKHLLDVLYGVFVYALRHWPRSFFSVVYGSDSEEKPLKGASLGSLNGDFMIGDSISRDSLVDYTEGGGEFDEDGSFIGEYAGRMHRGSVSGPSAPSSVTA